MTTTKPPRLTTEPAQDRYGRPCLRLPLSGRDGAGRYALIDEAGLEALQKAGARSLYVVGDASGRPYPCFMPRPYGSPMTAARCILGDPHGQRIEYVSGDRLDLRRSNLLARTYAGVGGKRLAKAATQ
jgi:hypothetical protein